MESSRTKQMEKLARDMDKKGLGCRRRRVVLVPFPFQGHINPMLQLGTILHSKGFSITVAHTQFNPPHASNHPDFVFLPFSDGLPSNLKFSTDFVSNINLSCRASLQEVLIKIIQEQEQQEELPCIIYDLGMYCTEAVARHLKVPSMALSATGATSLLAYYAYPRLLKEGHIPLQDIKSVELVPGLLPLRFKDLPVLNFEILDGSLQMIANLQNIGASSAIILNSMECLEQSSLTQLQQLYQVPIFPIGPMHKLAPASSSSLLEEDTSCIAWLDKQTENSVIYVSLGSIAYMDAKELEEMAWGLANSKQPFLWVLRPGSVHGSDSTDLLPEGFKETIGERGCIVEWAPQKKVLAHSAVGGFWTHCGWNSTVESVSEGVPMICRPSFGDQMVNGRYVSHVLEVGFQFEDALERGEIERAIKKLMVEKGGEEIRQKALDLKIKAELCIKEGGTSHNSLNQLTDLIISV